MFLAMMLAASAPAPVPPLLGRVDGNRIRPGVSCYAIQQDGAPIGATYQSVQATRKGRTPAWRIVVHQRIAGGRFELRDEFVVRRSDLRPLSLDSRRGTRSAQAGWHEIHVDYGRHEITGTRLDAGGSKAIKVPLTGPVWEGNLWGTTFAALPLRSGGRFRLPFWQYDKGFGTFIVNVIGSEAVEAPAGKTAAWVVEAGDDPKRLVRYLIAKRDHAELGYGAAGMQQRLGGDCKGMG